MEHDSDLENNESGSDLDSTHSSQGIDRWWMKSSQNCALPLCIFHHTRTILLYIKITESKEQMSEYTNKYYQMVCLILKNYEKVRFWQMFCLQTMN